MSVPVHEWKWFGNAGHFICGSWCQFHLCTQVGKYLISTVGQYLPDESVREIMAKRRGIVLEGRGDARRADFLNKHGFVPLGAGDGTFETLVFKAGKPCEAADCNCGLPALADASEIDGERYTTAGAATEGHMEYCEKFARKGLTA